MPTSKHTPTPWVTQYFGADDYSPGCIEVQPLGEDPQAICTVDSTPEGRANAEFIVRAVNIHADLLAALEEAVHLVSNVMTDRQLDARTPRGIQGRAWYARTNALVRKVKEEHRPPVAKEQKYITTEDEELYGVKAHQIQLDRMKEDRE